MNGPKIEAEGTVERDGAVFGGAVPEACGAALQGFKIAPTMRWRFRTATMGQRSFAIWELFDGAKPVRRPGVDPARECSSFLVVLDTRNASCQGTPDFTVAPG